jgi:hypothetical protein
MAVRPDFISAWAQCNANKITRTDAKLAVDDMVHAVKIHHPGRISMISPARRRSIGFCMHPVPASQTWGDCVVSSLLIIGSAAATVPPASSISHD